jgi:hypothetical protein
MFRGCATLEKEAQWRVMGDFEAGIHTVGMAFASLRSRSTTAASHLRRRLHRHWYLLLVVQTALLEAAVAVPHIVGSGRPDINHDAMFYLFMGWYWTQGGVPYLEVWDWKPPANPVFTAVLSLLAGGNPSRLAVLSVLTTAGAAVGIVALIGLLVYYYTDDAVAAYTGGTALLTFSVFFRLAPQGFRPKYFMLLFGFAAIYLLVRGYYTGSGASAAAAAGFWQFGIVFPVIVAVGAYRGDGCLESRARDRRWRVGRTVAGMIGATVLIVLPIVFSGAIIPMITQVVFGAFGSSEVIQPIRRLSRVKQSFGIALPIMALGVVGAILGRRTAWWVSVGTGWALLQVGVLDFTLYADLFLLTAFCAIGYGFLMHRLDEHVMPLLLVVGIVVLVIAQLMVGGSSLAVQPQPPPSDGSWDYERGTFEWYFWTHPAPDTCHIVRSEAERRLTRALGGSLSDAECRYGFWRWIEVVFG